MLSKEKLIEMRDEFQKRVDEEIKKDDIVGMEDAIFISQVALLDHLIKMVESDEQKGRLIVCPDIENNFSYHAPKEGQPEKYTAIREGAKELAYLINMSCPNSREKSLAMTKLEEAVFWANASIARNEK